MLQCIWQPPIICNGQYWLPPLHITQYAAAMRWCGGPNPLFLMFCNHICHIWYLDSCHEQLWCGGSNALSVMFCIHICCIWYLDSSFSRLTLMETHSINVLIRSYGTVYKKSRIIFESEWRTATTGGDDFIPLVIRSSLCSALYYSFYFSSCGENKRDAIHLRIASAFRLYCM